LSYPAHHGQELLPPNADKKRKSYGSFEKFYVFLYFKLKKFAIFPNILYEIERKKNFFSFIIQNHLTFED